MASPSHLRSCVLFYVLRAAWLLCLTCGLRVVVVVVGCVWWVCPQEQADLGHWPQLEDPERVAAALVAHFGRWGGAGWSCICCGWARGYSYGWGERVCRAPWRESEGAVGAWVCVNSYGYLCVDSASPTCSVCVAVLVLADCGCRCSEPWKTYLPTPKPFEVDIHIQVRCVLVCVWMKN